MKAVIQDILAQAPEAVTGCLADVPFCQIVFRPPDPATQEAKADLCAELSLAGSQKRLLLLQIVPSGQPRIVRNAANALVRYREAIENAYAIVVAPFITQAAGDILNADGIGYVDLAGNCRICFDTVYIRKEGNANKATRKRDLRSLYSPRAERILRVLMLDPKRAWKVKPLAEEAQVSLGQVSNVKKLLEAREWLATRESGFALARPDALLQEWAANYRFSRNKVTELYAMNSLDEIERSFGHHGALTSFSAAARWAPATRYQRVHAFIRGSVDALAQQHGWKKVASGGNILLLEPYDEGVFSGARCVEDVNIVSPIQNYLDLLSHTGRGAEAAEALLREVLQPSW